jgi:predicted esterase
MRKLWICCALLAACNQAPPSGHSSPSRGASARAAPSDPASEAELSGPIRMESLREGETPPTFVMRGGPRGPGKMVFLHGMCGHGLGYAQSFQFSAAKLGALIAPQGDVSCGGPWSSWSGDITKLDQRIVATFRELGQPEPIADITVIGMSLGATRAAALAQRFPERYTRLIAMAAPSTLGAGLRSLRGAVVMAGERDRQDLMKSSERNLRQSGVPVTFMVIPQATHGAMGPEPERTMGAALDFLAQAESTRSMP